jgi:seryl-tRNA synthetase
VCGVQLKSNNIEDQQSSNSKIIKRVIEQTEEKYAEYKKEGLKIRRSKGKSDINVRDIAYKILTSALSFKSIIDTAVSFDPTGHGNCTLTPCYCTTLK